MKDGVYAAWAEAGGVRYRAMAQPRVQSHGGGVARRLETHLIGFRGDLYGATLRVGSCAASAASGNSRRSTPCAAGSRPIATRSCASWAEPRRCGTF